MVILTIFKFTHLVVQIYRLVQSPQIYTVINYKTKVHSWSIFILVFTQSVLVCLHVYFHSHNDIAVPSINTCPVLSLVPVIISTVRSRCFKCLHSVLVTNLFEVAKNIFPLWLCFKSNKHSLIYIKMMIFITFSLGCVRSWLQIYNFPSYTCGIIIITVFT